MPKIKERYFPVAQKINRDPEIRQLKRDLGVTGFSMWLQVLAETDGQKGLWKGSARDIGGVLAGVCESNTRGSARFLQWVTDRGWIIWQMGSTINSWGGLIVAKHVKYHTTEIEKHEPENEAKDPPPSFLPNLPNLPKKTKEPPPSEAVQCAQLLSDRIYENLPNRTAPTEAVLLAWAYEAEKLNRIDMHSWAEIQDMIEWAQKDEFWSANILSMGTLRKQWNKLLAKKEKSNVARIAEPKGLEGLREWKAMRNRAG